MVRITRQVKFVYPPQLLDQPIVYSLIKQFDVVTNIRGAEFTDSSGWIIVDLEGSPAAIEQALAWAREQGVTVETM